MSCAGAGLLLAASTVTRAEEVEKKWRIAVSLGGYSTTDQSHSASANVRTLFYPDGELFGRLADPRNDSGAASDFGVHSEPEGVLAATYAFTRFWYVEGSVGYRRGTVGNVEVQAQFDGVTVPVNQNFNFAVYNLDGGRITQIPLQLTAGIRFRPKAAFNPYICGGVGYTFNGFTPSNELNDLSTSLDRSVGGFASTLGGSFNAPSNPTNLRGITVDVPNAPEWHLGGGLEYTVKSRWALYLDGRYLTYSGKLGFTINGSDELGVSVPADQRFITDPGAFGPFGAVKITTGGLIDGGSLVPKPLAPPGTDCAIAPTNCQFTGPPDGIKDTGYYYVHAGRIRYDGASFQFGFKYTF